MNATLLTIVPLLPLLRILAVAVAFPHLAGPGAPKMVRLGTSLVLALLLLPKAPVAPGASTAELLFAVPLEILVGLSIGYGASLVFHMLAMAGDFLGQEMGLNASSQLDPVTGHPQPLLARLFESLGMVVFLECGGLALLLRLVKASFALLPTASLLDCGRLLRGMTPAADSAVGAGIGLVLPAAAFLLLLTVFTTVAARALPRLHIFDFAHAVRMLAALFCVALLLGSLPDGIATFADRTFARLAGVLGGG